MSVKSAAVALLLLIGLASSYARQIPQPPRRPPPPKGPLCPPKPWYSPGARRGTIKTWGTFIGGVYSQLNASNLVTLGVTDPGDVNATGIVQMSFFQTATDYTAAVYAYVVLSNATMPSTVAVLDQTGAPWIDFSSLSPWYNATCTRSRDSYCYDSSYKFHSESSRKNADGKTNKVVRYAYGFSYVLQNASTSTGVFFTTAADGIAQVLANPAVFAFIPPTLLFPTGVIGGTFSNVTCS